MYLSYAKMNHYEYVHIVNFTIKLNLGVPNITQFSLSQNES